MTPTTVFAVPLFDKAAYVREAVESLLAQTDPDFAMILVDDCSTDGTGEIAREIAAQDPRVSYHRNERRLGLAANWQRGLQLAQERFPGATYFAWGSDHDRWAPTWLERLREAIEADQEVVLAYPHFERLDAAGGTRPRSLVPFSTRGQKDPLRRFAATLVDAPAGRMVYGLFRADALARTSGFRSVIAPDRLLLLELALAGQFVQVDDVLWSRRFRHSVSARRQRRASYPDGAPLRAYAPWWIAQPAVLAKEGARDHGTRRRNYISAAALYPALTAVRAVSRSASFIRNRRRRLSRRVRGSLSARLKRQ